MTKTSSVAEVPAILGGKPAFEKPVPITMPTVPPFESMRSKFEAVYASGILTNSANVIAFETAVAKALGVKHAVATNACTSGLMLLMKVMGLKGEVILPGFTFHATAHAVAWNGLTPVFVDSLPGTFNIDPAAVEKAITPKTSAIIGVHIFGAPCDVEALQAIAKKHKLRLLFDAAHGFGAQRKGRAVGGFGDAESFSLSPTKLVTAGEGGIVATNNEELAKKIKVARNYGDSGTYDCEFSGFNARMNECEAILGLESLKHLEENVTRRNKLAALYRKSLAGVPGLRFQDIPASDRSSFKDFAIIVEKPFGMSRDRLCEALTKENIVVRKYFYPAVHVQRAFSFAPSYKAKLPNAENIAASTLSLPLYSHMPENDVLGVAAAVAKIHEHRKAVNGASL